MKSLRLLLFVLLPVAILSGCQAVRSVEYSLSKWVISADQESKLGLQYSQEIEKEVPLLNDPALDAYVDRLGQALVRTSRPCEQTFTFKVTAAREVNAFAIPGGFCYINAGLIDYAENEAQLVAVVAHEVNHVVRRHGARSMQRTIGINAIGQVLTADPSTAALAQLAIQSGGIASMRSFGREDEREADSEGVKAMYAAGWDPRQGAEFFRRLNALEAKGGNGGGLLGQILASHPATEERIRNLDKLCATLDLSVPLRTNTTEFDEMKARARLLMPKGG